MSRLSKGGIEAQQGVPADGPAFGGASLAALGAAEPWR